MANDVKTFLKYVLEGLEEIGIHQENRGDSENFLSELLVYIYWERQSNFCMSLF